MWSLRPFAGMARRYQREVARAALPAVLFGPDVAVSLGILEDAADRLIRRGRFGPHLLVQGRPAILREAFLSSLADLASSEDGDGKEVLP